ncbi:FAD-binding protein [bacterium]|nr:MAG: FAD-binding protein [bacterium]
MRSVMPALEEAAAQHLVQRDPYPIVAAPNTQVIAKTIEAAQKTNQKILVIGSGSSFGAQFTLLREDIIAITTSGFRGINVQNEFAVIVAAGTPVAELVRPHSEYSGKTLGGLLAREAKGRDRDYQRAVWQKVALIEIMDGNGHQRILPGPAKANSHSSAGSDCLLGSRGRLCIITGIQFAQSLPIEIVLPEESSTLLQLSSAGRSPLHHEELSATLDPFSLFKW